MATETIVGGDLRLSAAELRREAKAMDERGDSVSAKRFRLAAWGQEFSASALRGEQDAIDPGRLASQVNAG